MMFNVHKSHKVIKDEEKGAATKENSQQQNKIHHNKTRFHNNKIRLTQQQNKTHNNNKTKLTTKQDETHNNKTRLTTIKQDSQPKQDSLAITKL